MSNPYSESFNTNTFATAPYISNKIVTPQFASIEGKGSRAFMTTALNDFAAGRQIRRSKKGLQFITEKGWDQCT
jgi:hypothetical protein